MIELPPTFEEVLLALVRESGDSDRQVERAAGLGHGFLTRARRGTLTQGRAVGRNPLPTLWTKLGVYLAQKLGPERVQAAYSGAVLSPTPAPGRPLDREAAIRRRASRPTSLEERARRSPEGLGWLLGTSQGQEWTSARHLALIDDVLLDAVIGDHPRTLLAQPPRHGKTEMVARLLIPWYLGTFPDRRVVLSTFSDTRALELGHNAKQIFEEIGPRLFGLRVQADEHAKGHWSVAGRKGSMRSVGVGGSIGGLSADLLVLDDPFKNQEDADSEAYRRKVWLWWTSTARRRLEPDGVAIICSTRWHEEDLVGHLLEGAGEEWRYVRLPAIAEDADDPLGRKPGEALWPERWSVQRLEVERATTEAGQARQWAALYQQRPAPEGGGMFQRAWFRHAPARPLDEYVLRFATVDLAASLKQEADYTVILPCGLAPDGTLHVLEVDRRRLEGPQIVPAIKAACARWRLHLVGIEAVAFQLAMVQLARAAGVPVRELRRGAGDKRVRAYATTPAFEARQVVWPADAPWRKALEEELAVFPYGKHDDQVDTVCDAVHLARTAAAWTAAPPARPDATRAPTPLADLTPAGRSPLADLAGGRPTW